jgi:N-carbamoylputrescine amidase
MGGPMKLTVASVQLTPYKAQVDRNLDEIAKAALQASQSGCDLVCFAESAVTGYLLEGGVLENALSSDALAEKLHQRLGDKLGRPIDIAVGFYELSDGQCYNSAAYLECSSDGVAVRHVYRKFFLPTYGVFDEERFVTKGRELGLFETRFGQMGFLICEDVWHSILPALLAVSGAQILLIPSASPARGFSGDSIGNQERYRRMLRAVSDEHGVFCVNTQLTGFEGGKGFLGGSSVTDPMGRMIAESPVQEDHLLIAELDLDLIGIARQNLPLISDLKSSWGDIRRFVSEIE